MPGFAWLIWVLILTGCATARHQSKHDDPHAIVRIEMPFTFTAGSRHCLKKIDGFPVDEQTPKVIRLNPGRHRFRIHSAGPVRERFRVDMPKGPLRAALLAPFQIMALIGGGGLPLNDLPDKGVQYRKRMGFRKYTIREELQPREIYLLQRGRLVKAEQG